MSKFFQTQDCEEYSKQRRFSEEHVYKTLYHNMEFAHYDYLQRGQYLEAKKLLKKLDSKISRLGDYKAWNKTKELAWIQHRMFARQLIESFGIYSISDPFGCKKITQDIRIQNHSSTVVLMDFIDQSCLSP